jgi:hypothetical protein
VNKEEGDAQEFIKKNAHFLQRFPYHQCSVSLRDEDSGKLEVRKFTSLGEEKWKAQHSSIS